MSFEIFCEAQGGGTVSGLILGVVYLKHVKALESTELVSIRTRIVLVGWSGTQKDRGRKERCKGKEKKGF